MKSTNATKIKDKPHSPVSPNEKGADSEARFELPPQRYYEELYSNVESWEVGAEERASNDEESYESQIDSYKRIDYGPGNGASTDSADISDVNPVTDFESASRTTFFLSDVPAGERTKWWHLRKWNNGMRNNYNDYKMENRITPTQRQRFIDKKRIAAALCSSCDLHTYETETVGWLATVLCYQSLGQFSRIEQGILGLIAIVVDVGREANGALSNQRLSEEERLDACWIHRQKKFKSLMTEFGLTITELHRLKRLIKQQVGEVIGRAFRQISPCLPIVSRLITWTLFRTVPRGESP